MLKGQYLYHMEYTYSKDLTWARWLQNWPWHSTSLSIKLDKPGPFSCPGFSGQWPYLESSLSTPLQLYLCCLKCHGVHLRSLKMFLIGKLGRISLAAVSFLATWGPHGTSMPGKHPITQLHSQNVGYVGKDAFNNSPFARCLFLQCSLVIVITWAISSQPSVKHSGKDVAWEWRDACAAALWAGETTYDAKHVRDSMGVERMSRHISNSTQMSSKQTV